MQRKALFYLKSWFKDEDRRPLLLRGARQVGKSTLVRLFCKKHGIDLFEINLEKEKLSCGKQDSISISSLIIEIEDLLQKQFDPKKSLLFIDEIQAQPKLFSYLRYFYEERPEIPIIAAGSLLEFYLSGEQVNIPVGRISYYYLGPMDFEEFLLARKQKILLQRMKNYNNLTTVQHFALLKLLKEYFYIGGMPAAIKTFIKTKNLRAVRQKHLDILQTYRDDFLKYARPNQVNALGKVFDFVPFNLGQKIKYSEIDSSLRAEPLRVAIQLLIKARVINPVYHTQASSLPISTFEDLSVFKLYFLDIGLVHTSQKITWDQLNQKFSDLNQIGPVHEQFIAQHLIFRSPGFEEPHLNYWLKDKTQGKAEVDFVFQEGIHIFPVEVKTGVSGSLKSLWQFIKEKKVTCAIQFYSDQYQAHSVKYNEPNGANSVGFKLIKCPHYLVSKILKILNEECQS